MLFCILMVSVIYTEWDNMNFARLFNELNSSSAGKAFRPRFVFTENFLIFSDSIDLLFFWTGLVLVLVYILKRG